MVYKFISVGHDRNLNEVYDGKPLYWIVNNRTKMPIGQIFWYRPWRRWCVRFKEDTVWSSDCLENVANAIAAIAHDDLPGGG
jgi:hypothetical protein